MKKGVFILPGFGNSAPNDTYREIMLLFEKKKIKPIFVKIDWKKISMTDYIEQFMKLYLKKEKEFDEVYLFGFSFGSMISFICSKKINPGKMILCSLSPWFKEDIPYLPWYWRKFTDKKLINDLKNYEFKEIIKEAKGKVIFVVGKREAKQCHKRTKKASLKMKGSKLIYVDAGHNLSNKNYLNKVKEIITDL